MSIPAATSESRRSAVERALFLLVVLVVAFLGIEVRRSVWEGTHAIRYRGDLQNAYGHGRTILRLACEECGLDPTAVPGWTATFIAYLHFYDRVHQGWPEPNYNAPIGLDYPPLRLLVMTVWTRWLYRPGSEVDVASWNACAPLIHLNTMASAAGAFAAYLLVRHWLRAGHQPVPCSVTIRATIVAVLVWINPAILVDAHAWPQWNVWIVPFYLFTLYAASTGHWMSAGLILGFGAMFKGQILVVAPVLLVWPLFSGQLACCWRQLIGIFGSLAIVESMWVISVPRAAAVVLPLWVVAILIVRFRVPHVRPRLVIAMGVCASIVLLAAVCFGASFQWFEQGFVFGGSRDSAILANTGVNNLGALLRWNFGWAKSYDVVTTVSVGDRSWVLTIGGLLKVLYAFSLVPCAVSLGICARHKDPRALFAMAAPWVLFYALMPQMACKYLLWGAVATAVCATLNVGSLLLHLLVSACSATTILHVAFLYSRGRAQHPLLFRSLNALHPGTSWLTVMLAGIFLYLVMVPIAQAMAKVRCRARHVDRRSTLRQDVQK